MNLSDFFTIHAFIPLAAFVSLALVFHYFFWMRPNGFTDKNRIQNKPFPKEQLRNEIVVSSINVFVAGLLVSWIISTKDRGFTLVYSDISKYGWGWYFGSFLLIGVGHEINYYFLHRFLHSPKLFRYLHVVHHRYTNPSVFAAFYLHPIETILVMTPLIPMVFLVPVHWSVIEMFTLFIGVVSMHSHSNVELMASEGKVYPFFKYFITSHHHNDHHRFFNVNYGYSFNVFDRLLRTERNYMSSSKEEKGGPEVVSKNRSEKEDSVRSAS